jgi:formamidopyrimidine-DNA glycosylase
MPELPEVETISRSLNKLVKGRTILKATLLRAKLAPETSPGKFAKLLRNKQINSVHRRGKHILFDLNGCRTLIVHLRMSGRFSILDAEDENPKFTHAVLYLDNGKRLVFDDQRHFGLMKIIKTSELNDAKELKKLAPEPFSDKFTPDYLRSIMKSSKRSLKELLIDQTKVCGLGNIYAAEAMFAAGVHPAKRADKVSKPKVSRLHYSIRAVLQEAISYADELKVDPRNLEGSYFSVNGTSGWFVYDREGELCRKCKTPISRLKQGGRSTYYCPRCQRA